MTKVFVVVLLSFTISTLVHARNVDEYNYQTQANKMQVFTKVKCPAAKNYPKVKCFRLDGVSYVFWNQSMNPITLMEDGEMVNPIWLENLRPMNKSLVTTMYKNFSVSEMGVGLPQSDGYRPFCLRLRFESAAAGKRSVFVLGRFNNEHLYLNGVTRNLQIVESKDSSVNETKQQALEDAISNGAAQSLLGPEEVELPLSRQAAPPASDVAGHYLKTEFPRSDAGLNEYMQNVMLPLNGVVLP